MPRPKSSFTPTLKDLAIAVIDDRAAEIKQREPRLSLQQCLAKAVHVDPEAIAAWRVFQLPASALPLNEALVALASGQAPAPVSMRAQIVAKRGLAKEGGSGGSGPLGGNIENPKISGPVRPADTIPAKPNGRNSGPRPPSVSPADAIYAGIRAAALRAAPAGMSEAQAISSYLQTSAGQADHARWNAAHAAGA